MLSSVLLTVMRKQFLYEPLRRLLIDIDELDSHLHAMGCIGLLTHNASIHAQPRAIRAIEDHCDGLRRCKEGLLQIQREPMLGDVPCPHSHILLSDCYIAQ